MEPKKSRFDHWRKTRFLGAFSDVVSFLHFAFRRFFNDGLGQAASALTYSTLLALVPLLVIAFAVLSGFPIFEPVKQQMEELLLRVLVPEIGSEIRVHLAEFTRNASNLTAAGIIALPVTAVLLLSTIESTFNRIWKVDRPRPLVTRLLVFWALLTFGPLLIGASLALTTDVMKIIQDRALVPTTILSQSWLTVGLAVLMQSAAFSLLYMLIPARSVRLRDAVIGGGFAALGFQVLRTVFNTFISTSISHTTIYGAVAVIPIFLIWMYLSWTVIILGAVLAASFPDWWRRRDSLTGHALSSAEKLEVAVALLATLAGQASRGGAMAPDQLAEAIPLLSREPTIDALQKAGYIVEAKDQGLSLARDLRSVSIVQLARDLDLSLGRTGDVADRPALKRVSDASGTVPGLLLQLKGAEDEILNGSIAAAIAGKPSDPKYPVLQFTRTKFAKS